MRSFLTLGACVTLFAALACAETLTGALVDANCSAATKNPSTCAPTTTTTSFVLDANGTIYKLDAAGNTKAQDAIKSRADRSKDPNASDHPTVVMAKITGTPQGDLIKVDTLEVQ